MYHRIHPIDIEYRVLLRNKVELTICNVYFCVRIMFLHLNSIYSIYCTYLYFVFYHVRLLSLSWEHHKGIRNSMKITCVHSYYYSRYFTLWKTVSEWRVDGELPTKATSLLLFIFNVRKSIVWATIHWMRKGRRI